MGRINITTTISEEDWKFIKENGLKVSELLSSVILERKQQIGQEIFPTFKEEMRKREAWQKQASELREYLEKRGLLDDWIKEKTKNA